MLQDIEPREVIYNRTGILSQTTEVNQKVAQQFMAASGLRRDVLIVDSDREPEKSTVAVGSDVLAWRSIVPINELTRVIFRSKKYHEIEVLGSQNTLRIHDRIIDDDVKKEGYKDKTDYDQRYLTKLRKGVKDGMAEILWSEKLGIRDQSPNWFPYFSGGSLMLVNLFSEQYLGAASFLAALVFVIPPIYNYMDNIRYEKTLQFMEQFPAARDNLALFLPPNMNYRSWKEALMPPVPIDKWIRGRRFLAKHGEELVIARS